MAKPLSPFPLPPSPPPPLTELMMSTSSQPRPLWLHECKTSAYTSMADPHHHVCAWPCTSSCVLKRCQPTAHHHCICFHTGVGVVVVVKMVLTWKNMLTARASTAATVPVVGPNSCSFPCSQSYVCVWNRPLPLYRHLQLTHAADCVYSTWSGHHPCLPWSQAAAPSGAADDPNSFCSEGRFPEALLMVHAIVNV